MHGVRRPVRRGLGVGAVIGHRPPDWTIDAACVGIATRDRDPWSPDTDRLTPDQVAFEYHLARRICHTCPVRVDCATDALTTLPRHEEHAMRGGLTPDELLDLARDMGMKWRREAQHGTRSKYVSGCHCDDCRDAHRIYEHERRLWAKSKRGRQVARVDVYAHLTRPVGRGKRCAGVGQLVLFTEGLRPSLFAQEAAA